MSEENMRDDEDDESLLGFEHHNETDKVSFQPQTYSNREGFGWHAYLFFKRAFDLIGSTLFIILFSWLFLILAIVVKCGDGGKVFYKHKRVGRDGKEFVLLKFRSMKENSDDLEKVLTHEQYEEYMREYKIDVDPRITKVGKFLRKTSLDELPNIFSVWKGDLSVVGPRPLLRDEANDKYREAVEELLSVKPGLTGWWAVNGRNNVTYVSGERQKFELYYVEHCSVGLDIKIMFKSVIGVFKRKGAK